MVDALVSAARWAARRAARELLDEDAAALCRPPSDGSTAGCVRSGTVDGTVLLAGQRMPIRRPLLRSTNGTGGEVPLLAYQVLTSSDVLSPEAVEAVLAGDPAAGDPAAGDPAAADPAAGDRARAGSDTAAPSSSISAVHRRMVALTRRQVHQQLKADLSGLEATTLTLGGVELGGRRFVAAVARDRSGRTHLVALRPGRASSAKACRRLVAELRERGLALGPDSTVAGLGGGRMLRWRAFWSLCRRDVRVLRKQLRYFAFDVTIQPLLLMFVLTYVFPKINLGVGGPRGARPFATLLLGGLVAQAIAFQGIFRVAVPLARELDITQEMEDRVLAPVSVRALALEKITVGALQGLLAGLVVFPIAALLPATDVYLRPNWWALATIPVLGAITSASVGLAFGTWVQPQAVPVVAGTVALFFGFLGAVFYPWKLLSPIPWLKYLVLVNPLVYVSEGLRGAVSTAVPHMSLFAVYAGLAAFSTVSTVAGVRGLRRRVVT